MYDISINIKVTVLSNIEYTKVNVTIMQQLNFQKEKSNK